MPANLIRSFLLLIVKQADTGKSLSDVVMQYLQQHGEVHLPKMGRLIAVTPAGPKRAQGVSKRASALSSSELR